MILDGYWKKELIFQAKMLSFLQKPLFGQPLQEHIANKAVLISAIAARKAYEDERWSEQKASNTSQIHFDSDLLKQTMSVTVRDCIEDDDYPPGHVIVELYGTPKSITIEPTAIINSIIHAYYWDWIYDGRNRLQGFLVASDFKRRDCLYAVTLDEWISFLKNVNRLGHIY